MIFKENLKGFLEKNSDGLKEFLKDEANNISLDGLTSDKFIEATVSGETVFQREKIEIQNVKISEIKLKNNSNSFKFICLKDTGDPYGYGNYPNRAAFIVGEEKIALKLDIEQKRLPAVLITSGETWAKSFEYDITIMQDSFDPKYEMGLIPGSSINLGLRFFKIEEDASYRIEYYKDYFSAPKAADPRPGFENELGEPGIKEADVLAMLMNWEEQGTKGLDSAYTCMRDLYKLIIYMRDKGRWYEENSDKKDSSAWQSFWQKLLEKISNNQIITEEDLYHNPYIIKSAYSYLYLPEVVWGFEEGLTQEIFWTERLAADPYGEIDALSAEEQEKFVTRSNEIEWQVLEYQDYDECNKGGNTVVYALFPYGNSLVRTAFMHEALNKAKFDDGGYTSEHRAADWHGRARLKKILNDTTGLYADIRNYEILNRTLINIYTGTGNEEDKLLAAKDYVVNRGSTSNKLAKPAYDKAKEDVEAELEEAVINCPVVAIAPGTVDGVGYNATSGFYVSIKHDSGGNYKSKYSHLRRWPSVEAGDNVGAGTIIGYEGDTGMSTGTHLHFALTVDGKAASPSAYLAPIYAPFYNANKITEFMTENEEYVENKLMLSTDYLSLTRTVLMANFKSNGEIDKINNPTGAMMPACSLIRAKDKYGDYNEYAYSQESVNVFYGIIPNSQYEEPGADGVTGIIKVGAEPNEIFYKITFTIMPKTYIKNDKLMTSIFSDSTILWVKKKEEINKDSELLAEGIKIVKDENGATENKQVSWGVGTPLNSLMKYKNLLDKSIYEDVDVQFNPRNIDSKYKKNKELNGETYANTVRSEDRKYSKKEYDVRISEKYFKADTLAERYSDQVLDAKVSMTYCDLTSEYSVPFYDGPFDKSTSLTPSTGYTYIGNYGSNLNDLALLQSALVSRGFADGQSQNTIGDFDDVTAQTLEDASDKIADLLGLPAGGGEESKYYGMYREGFDEGKVGKSSTGAINSVVGWNAYVTYGAQDNAERAAYAAIANAVVHFPSANYWALIGACGGKSDFIPTKESELLEGAKSANYATGNSDFLFYYNGDKVMVRRAQGLFGINPDKARRYYATGDENTRDTSTLIALRSPYANALMAADILNANKVVMLSGDYVGQIKQMIESGEQSGKNDWKDLANRLGADPVDLVLNVLAVMGMDKDFSNSSNVNNCIKELRTIKYEFNGGRYTIYNSSATYYSTFVPSMISTICNQEFTVEIRGFNEF